MSDVNAWGTTGSGGNGITLPLSVSQGGTGSIDAAGARTALSVPSVADLNTAVSLLVAQTSATGAAKIPTGTTAQRDASPQEGWIRRNKTLAIWEGFDGTAWVPLGTGSGGGGGTSGGAVNGTFYESIKTMTSDYTVPVGSNSMCAGPLTINDGTTLLVSDGSTLTVV